MFKIREKMIYTGFAKRKSKRTEQEYIIVNFLDNEGNTFGSMLKCDMPSGINQLDTLEVEFEVIPGRYMQLNVLSLKKI